MKTNAEKLKTKMQKSTDFSRILIARNYDTVSFNFKGRGRFQVRFMPSGLSHLPNRAELYFNGQNVDVDKFAGTMTLSRVRNMITNVGSLDDVKHW